MTGLPNNHSQRIALSNEMHARPPYPVRAGAKVSCIALKTEKPFHDDDRHLVRRLAEQFDAPPPMPGKKHHRLELDAFTLVWEHHTEFVRYTFFVDDPDDRLSTAMDALPEAWVADLPGDLISATHVHVLKKTKENEAKTVSPSDMLIGSDISGGQAVAKTDFRVHEDGFSKFLLLDGGMSPLQLGRAVQRLLEIDTYRILALFALPVAQELIIDLSQWEVELSEVTDELADSPEKDDTELLERLTGLQAAIERSSAKSQFRFSAAAAYYSLVQRRTAELREERLPNMQMFAEFIERRLAPAMATCTSVERRLTSLSQRVDRATQLLSTKVNLSLEHQNQSLMESMDRRAALQLTLQQTVEGLSIAAISYYLIGIVNYVAKGISAAGFNVNEAVITGAAVPVVLGLTAFTVWRMRAHISKSNPTIPDD
jgi:uncharacterized membrane-anchored protein